MDPDDGRWRDEPTLLAGLRRRDADAFRYLVRSLHAPLVRLARLYLPAALAEEVVQDTWLAVAQSIGAFEGRAAVKTSVYRIMLNKVRTVAKRETRIVPFASVGPNLDVAPSVEPDGLVHPELGAGYWPEAPARWETRPEEQFLASETMAVVTEAMAKLPNAQREVITLRDVEGWSSQEVCDALGISSVCADAIELVTDFLDDALSRDDLAEFEAHLRLCEGCRAYLDQVRRTITITTESCDHTVKLTPANFDHLLDLFTRQPQDDGTNGDEP